MSLCLRKYVYDLDVTRHVIYSELTRKGELVDHGILTQFDLIMIGYDFLTICIEGQCQGFLQTLVVHDALDGKVTEQP